MVVREMTLVTVTVEEVRLKLPFPGCRGQTRTTTVPSSIKQFWTTARSGVIELTMIPRL